MPATYVFIGDSITCADRFWLLESDGLGCGYVAMLAHSLKEVSPDTLVLNKGYDGFTVPSLMRRLPEDCICKNPDYVTVLVGINDIGIAMNTGISLKEQDFAGSYDRLLSSLCSGTHASILCVAPFIFPHPQEYANWIVLIREAENTIVSLCAKYQVSFVSVHDNLNAFAAQKGYAFVTPDGIHLTEAGHRFLAGLLLPYYQ